MRQFYETYNDTPIVSAVLTQLENKSKEQGKQIVPALLAQLSWTNHIIILSKAKTQEERILYMQMDIKMSALNVLLPCWLWMRDNEHRYV